MTSTNPFPSLRLGHGCVLFLQVIRICASLPLKAVREFSSNMGGVKDVSGSGNDSETVENVVVVVVVVAMMTVVVANVIMFFY